jgi:Rieske Fe-S protein
MAEAETPKWRTDFPIEWEPDNYVTRREFTRFLVMVSGATVVGNGYFVLSKGASVAESAPAVQIAKVDELQLGQVKLFRYPTEDDPAILIRLANGEHVAYLQRCTHLSCPVHFAAARNRLECPCHNGAFDAVTGALLEGPPPRPLPRIKLRIDGADVLAEGLA